MANFKELHYPEYHDVMYPVAANIDSNYEIIEKMAKQFYELAKDDLQDEKITLVCRGSSGTITATIFYAILKVLLPNIFISICHIKKEGENSHSCKVGKIHFEGKSIFVDDFIATGSTLRKSIEAIKTYYRKDDFIFNYAIVSNLNGSKSLEDAGLGENEAKIFVYSPNNLRK